MLTKIHITNYALIDDLEIEFDTGLTIITGETGAGKSILINALGLVLGERAEAGVIRKDASKAIVEAFIQPPDNEDLRRCMREAEIESDDTLILRREVLSKGQSRCFVNDSPVTLSVLKSLGDLLVDLHGQHEHQSLLRTETHIGMLDEFAGIEPMVEEFARTRSEVVSTMALIRETRRREEEIRQRQALHAFQLREIDSVAPEEGEDDRIASELRILEHSEQLFEATRRLSVALYDGEDSIYDRLVSARNELERLSAIDSTFAESLKESVSALAIVKELARSAHDYHSTIDFSSSRLEDLRNRLGKITALKKTYGGSLSSVLEHRRNIGEEMNLIENAENEIKQLTQALDDIRDRCSSKALELSKHRTTAAAEVDAALIGLLEELGIPKARFSTVLSRKESVDGSAGGTVHVDGKWFDSSERGIDRVEFFIATNPGEQLKPLAKVASGGEISRVMLALKRILSTRAKVPLLIFDEIDVGVSGKTAQSVGKTLKKLSSNHQVVAITHLPQIAGLADHHLVVEKREVKGRSITSVRSLTSTERVVEVARLLSGNDVTEAGLRNARELIASRT